MAVPKRKTSKARKRIRRSHHGLSRPALTKCQRCRTPKRPHVICGNCGFYKGKFYREQVLDKDKL